jgi:hypothetical protein
MFILLAQYSLSCRRSDTLWNNLKLLRAPPDLLSALPSTVVSVLFSF